MSPRLPHDLPTRSKQLVGSTFPRDLRPPHLLARYHKRARRRVPWLQTIALALLLPLVTLVSRVRVTGREHIPDGGYIVAANHPSNFDPVFVALAIRRRIRFMGKSELFNGRGGWLLNRFGAFPVRRGVWDTDAFETAAAVLVRGRVMSMFPEGGVHTARAPAKSGIGHIAHLAGATVLPLHLEGTRALYTPWRWGKVRVVIGPPLRISESQASSRERSQATAERILDAIYALAPRQDRSR